MSASTKNKTILYLTYDGLTDHIGQSQIMPYIVANADRGFKFHILSFEKSGNTEKIQQVQQVLDSHSISWHRLQFSTGNMIFKAWDVFKFIFLAFYISIRYGCGIIHSRSYMASSIGLAVKWLTGKKLIFDKRDFWIDAKVETHRINPAKASHKPVYKALRFFERRLFRQADHIVSLTHAAKEIVLQKYPQRRPEEISVIPCCADLSLFNPANVTAESIAEKKQSLGLNGPGPVFGYVGSIDPAYFISELLDCFKVIRTQEPGAKMLFLINNGAEQLQELAGRKGISMSDLVITSAPRAQMPLHISLFDIGLFFIMPSYAKKASSPTKQFEMLAMRKPIITNEGVGDAARIMKELDCGFLVTEFTEAQYGQVAAWALQHRHDDRAYDMSHYSLEYGAASYNSIYHKLGNSVA